MSSDQVQRHLLKSAGDIVKEMKLTVRTHLDNVWMSIEKFIKDRSLICSWLPNVNENVNVKQFSQNTK